MRRSVGLWATVSAMALPSLLGAGCQEGASLRLRLEAPGDGTLSPLDARVASLTLVVAGEGLETRIQTRAVIDRSEPLDLGDVPIADGLSISLVASDAAGRLIGFGRAEGPVDVDRGDENVVTLRMRRPFAYLSGGPTLVALDPTLDPSQAYRSSLAVSAPQAVATTRDGADLLVVSGDQLLRVTTESHGVVPGGVTLSPGARDLTVSTDGAHVLVAHPSGVTVVDLAALRAGGAVTPTFLPVGNVGAIVARDGLAFALVDASDGVSCGTTSIAVIDLATSMVLTQQSLGRAAADLAVDPDGGQVYVALPCDGHVATLSSVGAEIALGEFLVVPGPTTAAVASGRLWALGHVDGSGTAHLVMAQKRLDDGAETRVTLPVPQERARAIDPIIVGGPGQAAEMTIQADNVRALDLAVLPDGSRLAVLVRAHFHSEETEPDPFFGVIIPDIDIDTWEYQLLDAVTGAPLQRLRTRCVIDWAHNAFLDNFVCTQAVGQDLAAPPFEPGDATVLYGER